jgi:hypothetical protein
MSQVKATDEDRGRRGAAVFAARMRMIALALLVLPAFALAQTGGVPKGNPRLASLNIEIWPEYDRPAALVILRGALAEGVKLPAAITLRLPAASGGPGAVAYSTTADGNLLNLKHERANSGEFVTLKFEVPERFFHVEFYEPIATGAAARAYRYVWPGDLAVERVTVVVQEPVSASEISVEPRLEGQSTGQDGLRYRTAELGKLEAGKQLPIALRYTKLDATPSKPKATEQPVPVTAPAPAMAAAPSLRRPAQDCRMVLPLAAMALLGYSERCSFSGGGGASRRRQPATQFCAKCGAAQAPGSRFCATCGARSRLGCRRAQREPGSLEWVQQKVPDNEHVRSRRR